MKPYYDHDGIVIYHADCREVLPVLGANCAIVTDPPYGISYKKGAGGKGAHTRRNIEPVVGDDVDFDPSMLLRFDNVLCWGADHYSSRLPHGRWLAWDKLAGMDEFDSFSDVEFAWHNRRGKATIFRMKWKGIACSKIGEQNGRRWHPTQKPLALMKWSIVQSGSLAAESTILDPFMGSGTTLRAAKDLGLSAIGIEIEERYCEIAAKRMEQGVLQFEPAGVEASA